MLLTPPHYIPYDDEQIFSFYKYVNDHVDMPIMVYNNPAVAGRDLTVPFLRRIAGLKNVFAVKQATGSLMNFVHCGTISKELLLFTASSSHQPMGAHSGRQRIYLLYFQRERAAAGALVEGCGVRQLG